MAKRPSQRKVATGSNIEPSMLGDASKRRRVKSGIIYLEERKAPRGRTKTRG